MQIDQFMALAKRRRSIRRFKPDPVPEEYVEKVLEAGRWAMSGANAQPWELIVVRNKETIGKLANAYFEDRRQFYEIEQSLPEDLRHLQLVNPPGMPTFKDAPVLIVVCGDRRTVQATVLAANFLHGDGGTGSVFIANIANVTQMIHLAVAALGLGSQWVTVNRINEEPMKDILGVPNVLELHTIVPIGYPSYQAAIVYRRERQEFVHYEKYNRSLLRSGAEVVNYIRELRNKTRTAYRPEREVEKKGGKQIE